MPEIEYLGPLEDKAIKKQSSGPKIEYVGPLKDTKPASDSPIENFVVGVWQGLKRFGQGMKQITLRTDELLGMPHVESADDYTSRIMNERAAFRETAQGQSTATRVGEFVGETAPYMAIPPLRGVKGGAVIGGTVGATQFVPEGDSRLQNTLIGAGAGAAIPAIGAGISKVATKTKNAIVGKVPKDAKKLVNLSEKHDVPISYPDIARGPVAPKVGTYLEQVPGIGMGKFRQQQHDKALQATRELLSNYAGGDDWAGIAKDSMLVKAKGLKTVASRYYDDLAKVADSKGDIPLTGTLNAIDDAIRIESESKIPDKAVLNLLSDIKTKLSSNNAFSNIRDFRSDLGYLIKDYYSGKNAIVGQKGVGLLQNIKNSVDDDIATWSKSQGGNIYAMWKRADSFYRDKVIPYRNTQLFSRIKNETDPDVIYSLFKQGVKARPQSVYNALPFRGQEAIRYGIIRDAYEGALKLEGTQFSPARFAGALEKQMPAIKTFFKGRQQGELKGFINLMRHVERAGQFMENPPTGNRNLINFVMGGGAVGLAMTSPETLAATAGSTYFVKTLFTTKSGKQFLLASSAMKPGTKQAVQMVESYMARIAAEMAVKEEETK